MPLVLSGIILTFKRKHILGFLLTTIALGLELVANHFQMTYYLLLLVIILGIAFLIDAFKKKELHNYFKSVAVLIPAVVLAIALNATNIMATQEYVKESTRGKSELTINPDGTPKEVTSGLDRDYITQFSYGFWETFNLYIPRFMGGGNSENVGKDSATYKLTGSEVSPTYWGDQPIVEAPAYIGAVILFLFVFGLFIIKGRMKWWLVAGTIFSLFLSYGKNLGFLTDFFIDYVPLYNKFRAVTSIQVIMELCIPVLAILGLSKLFKNSENNKEHQEYLKYAVIITGGIALLFLLFKSSLFDFSGSNDGFYRQSYGQDFINAIKEDRKSMFVMDTMRTLVLVLLTASVIFLYLKKKLKQNWVLLVLGCLILFDMVGIDRRYVNNKDFVSAIKVNRPFQASAADNEILKDKSFYRVFDLVSGPSKPSYYHNSLNGYNAAELKRYSELFDFYIAKNNIDVLNMLNTKYIIAQDKDGTIFTYTNEEANGGSWFVSELKSVQTPNEEIVALDSLNTKRKAVINTKWINKENYSSKYLVDSTATMLLITHQPNYLKYKSNNDSKGFAVFSEIYYPHGWQAFIDSKPVNHSNVDYVLRGMEIPSGAHMIEFKFEPKIIQTGSKIALASSVLVGLLVILGVAFGLRKKGLDSA